MMKRRTTIEIEDALLRDAQAALGTRGLKRTVDRALTEAVHTARRRRLAERLADGTAFDFDGAPIDRAAQWRR